MLNYFWKAVISLFLILTVKLNYAMESNIEISTKTGLQAGFHDSTNWVVTPSLKYDMLCFMNILTGDTFYTRYYTEEYDMFKDKLTPEAKDALMNIKRVIKDENGGIVSAWLCLYYSASDAETPGEMLEVLDDLDKLKESFSKTVYHDEESWQRFASLRGYLRTAIQFLVDIKFPQYWEEKYKPMLLEKADSTRDKLDDFNVVKDVERHLGFPLEDNSITLYVLYYSKPHGVKITGTRFLSFGDYPFKIALRTAVHEMMHPPFDKNDKEFMDKLEIFKQDEFVMDKVLNHDPAFGYNSFMGVIEEDCVQALDQAINTRYNAHVEPRFRWKDSDGGMHAFAAALYSLMEKEGFDGTKEKFRGFLIRMIDEGKLIPGKVKEVYDRFYEGYEHPIK
jgi:hypothetical protein